MRHVSQATTQTTCLEPLQKIPLYRPGITLVRNRMLGRGRMPSLTTPIPTASQPAPNEGSSSPSERVPITVPRTSQQIRGHSGRATRVGPRAPREIADIRFQNRVSEIVFQKTVSKRANPKTISNYRSPIMIACPIFRILEQDYFRPQVDPTSCSKVFATTQDTTPS
jgi:hypothetical protein